MLMSESLWRFLRPEAAKFLTVMLRWQKITQEKFKLSKSAFKRATGHFLKTGLVRQEEGWLYLIEDKLDGHD